MSLHCTRQREEPFAVLRQDGQPMAFAGLWEGFRWPSRTITLTFVVVVTTAGADVAVLHDRMLMTLEPWDWSVG